MNDLATTNTGLAAQSREIAAIQSAYQMALARPRDEDRAEERILKACQLPAFADAARYSFSRGGALIEGLSIDAAREMARLWGNLRHGWKVVDRDGDRATIQGWALDLETNTQEELETSIRVMVQRKRDGKTVWTEPDERDERELLAKAGAVVERNAILHLMPAHLREAALTQILGTLKKAAAEDLAGADRRKRIDDMIAAFARVKVSTGDLKTYLGHSVEQVTPEEIVKLQGVFAAIGRKEMTREDMLSIDAEPAKPEPKKTATEEPTEEEAP